MPAIEALIHQQPGNGIFDNVPDGAEIGAVPVASCPDQGQNPAHAAVRAIILAVVTGISDQVADIGTDDQCPIEQMAEQPGVVDVGRRGDRRQGQAVGINDDMVPSARFAAGFGPTRSPPRLARTLQLSTTMVQGALIACGPPRTIRIRQAWSCCRTPVDVHAARRRRKVAPETRPGAARSARHCTPSRRKK
jgi:hypothetical protein